jgi:hypothetical protein
MTKENYFNEIRSSLDRAMAVTDLLTTYIQQNKIIGPDMQEGTLVCTGYAIQQELININSIVDKGLDHEINNRK